MRTFKRPNLSGGWKCPVCGTADEKEVVLIGIVGTEDGGNIQAEQFHLSCINLIWDKSHNLIYQQVTDAGN